MSSGATVLARCCGKLAADPEDDLLGADLGACPARAPGRRHRCGRRSGGPSGSLGARMTARDGCREASAATVAIARSWVSGRGATTTSVSTLVRVRTRTCPGRHPARGPGGGPRGQRRCPLLGQLLAAGGLLGDADPQLGQRARSSRGWSRMRVPAPASGRAASMDDGVLQPAPSPPVPLDEPVGGLRPPGAGLVGLEAPVEPRARGRAPRPCARPWARPVIAAALVPACHSSWSGDDDAPGGLHLVGAGEQRGVAQHRVEDERLVRLRGVAAGTTSRR